MLDHFRKFAKYGMILATVQLPVITSDTEFRLDLDKIGEDVNSKGSDQITSEDVTTLVSNTSFAKMNKRLKDVAYDMARLKYI